ncbi:MAG: RNA polymerase sigma factor [Oscillospiraceae bacterium]
MRRNEAIEKLAQKEFLDKLYGFVWTVAHRVYADYCNKRSKYKTVLYADETMNISTNTIDDLDEKEDDKEKLKAIMCEISFLSKIYREVMVMYYIDDLSVFDIAKKLCVSENAVKQRLFSARNTIKKESVRMDKNFALKPVDIAFVGTGNPIGYDPRTKAERVLSKNVVYLCKNEVLSQRKYLRNCQYLWHLLKMNLKY